MSTSVACRQYRVANARIGFDVYIDQRRVDQKKEICIRVSPDEGAPADQLRDLFARNLFAMRTRHNHWVNGAVRFRRGGEVAFRFQGLDISPETVVVELCDWLDETHPEGSGFGYALEESIDGDTAASRVVALKQPAVGRERTPSPDRQQTTLRN